MSAVSEIEFLRSQREINSAIIKLLEGQNKQFDERSTLLELQLRLVSPKTIGEEPPSSSRPLADGQTGSFKNLGSNEFITIDGEDVKKSDTPDTLYTLSGIDYPGQFYIGNEECSRFFHFASTHKVPDVVWSVGTYKKETKSRWIFEKKSNCWLIYSCYKKELNRVLIQNGDIYTCMSWDDIKGTDLEKFAYWLVSN